jgi:hypothetical protein
LQDYQVAMLWEGRLDEDRVAGYDRVVVVVEGCRRLLALW